MNIKEINNSRDLKIIKDGWLYGELFNRIGNPFQWVDGDQMHGLGSDSTSVSIMQYLAMSGEIYPLHKNIIFPDWEKALGEIESEIRDILEFFIPKDIWEEMNVEQYIKSTASVKIQDYATLKTFGVNLGKGSRHLDIGPGLGANAIYSTKLFNFNYIPLDAHPISYAVQSEFFRMLTSINSNKMRYVDPITLFSLGLTEEKIKNKINFLNEEIGVIQCPSWYFSLINTNSIDLITATWVLNEVNAAGICWLLYNSTRALKKGGYFYIRDSEKLKPNRHQINYDNILKSIGFELENRLNVKNRVDMHGVPRIYRKNKSFDFEKFENFYNEVLDFSGSYAHGGKFVQN